MIINLPSEFKDDYKNGYIKSSKVIEYILNNIKGAKTTVSDINKVALKDITINDKAIIGGEIDTFKNELILELK